MMHKFWLVARAEYLRLVRRRAFLLATFGMPLLIMLIIGVSILLSVRSERGNLPLGVVDEAGVLVADLAPERYAGEDGPEIRIFESREAADAALNAADIQAYYVLNKGYLQSGQVELYYWDEPPKADARSAFDRFMRANLLADQPEAVQRRLLQGVDLVLRTADGRRQASENDFASFVLPFVIGMFFVFVVMGTAGYLLQAVTTEKENRMVEVMFTSVGSYKLIAGKALGLMAVALTQVGMWILAVAVGVMIAARYITFLQTLQAPWGFLGLVLLFFLPTYALIAGIMITVGSMVTELQQAQQIAGMVNLLFVVPFFFTVFLFTNPDNAVMVALTLFPTTAFITVAMRWGVTVIPIWQLVLSWVLLAGSAVTSVWVAARVFRVGMLRYGQSISLRGLYALLSGQRTG
ncbi:MAG: ABC transporter permease [Caldilineae bacterium]|nr:MAG: ABC transporter permease [Caldilineae bacterium]